MSSASNSNISSGSLEFLQFFPLTAPIEFPNIKETEKRLKSPLVLSSCDSVFSLHEYYFANPNGASVHNLIVNNISKLNENPTVNEKGIVVLLRAFWVSAGKEKGTVRRVFLLAPTWFCNFQR